MSTPHVEASLSGCDALVLECNHDLDMLASGDYPCPLKQRIAGRFGHLHNEAAAALLARIDTSQLQHIIAAHLSQQNNTPELARDGACGGARLRAGMDRHRRPGDRFRLARALIRQGEDAWKSGRSSTRARPRPSTRPTTRTTSSCTIATTSRRSTASSSRSSTQKGETNNKINAYVMGKLAAAGVPTHFVRVLNERDSLVKAMKMIPVECVVRNVCAGLDGEALRHRRGNEAAGADLRVLLQERCAARSAVQRRSHPRAGLGERATRSREMKRAHAQGQRSAEAAVRRTPASTSSITSSSSGTRPTIPTGRSCWATSSRPTVAGCGMRRPARSSTRIASAAIWASVIEHYREVARAHRRAAVMVSTRSSGANAEIRSRPRFAAHSKCRAAGRAFYAAVGGAALSFERGRPGLPRPARRPNSASTFARKWSLPSATLPFVALRIAAITSDASCSWTSAWYASRRCSAVVPSLRIRAGPRAESSAFRIFPVARPAVSGRIADHSGAQGVKLDVAVAGETYSSFCARQERKRPSHNVPERP